MKDEIKEILDKLKNRKQETLIQGLRECQLKDIEHPFITKEEYIDKVLDYITNLQEENKELNRMCEIYSKSLYNADLTKAEKRIDKAIEYIKNHKETRKHYEPYGTPMGNPNYITTHVFGYYELLNILNGDDE